MSFKKSSLLISKLKPGMISASDITFEGKLLVAKNVAITEQAIEKLKKNYIINKVDVYIEDTTEFHDNSKVKSYEEPLNLKIKTIHELENTFNEFSSNLKDIFNDISNLKVPEIDPIRVFSKKLQDELKSTGIVIRDIVFYGSKGDPIYRHSINTAAISYILGKWLNFSEKELNLLTYSAIFHDFGKMQLSKNLLNKFPNLTQKEYETYKSHVVLGYNFVKRIPYLNFSVTCGVLMHHEKMDGLGYPFGIKEDKIHKFAKIIAIADLFDNISSDRYFKKVNGPFEALKFIQDEGLGKLDCKYCNVFLNHIINYYIGENVILSNNKSYKVIQVNITDLTKPLLLDDNGFLDLKNGKDLYVKKLVP